MILQESGEMYLETILVLLEKNGQVRSLDIAEYMNFSKPSVSRAVHNLRDNNYINVDKNGLITLTESGMKIASSIYDRHKVLTTYLNKIGVDKTIAEEDACKIEHDISEETFSAIKKQLLKL